jgi:hypothetical protein
MEIQNLELLLNQWQVTPYLMNQLSAQISALGSN